MSGTETERCAVCGVGEATCRGPTVVNGRLFLGEPLCDGCAIGPEQCDSFVESLADEYPPDVLEHVREQICSG